MPTGDPWESSQKHSPEGGKDLSNVPKTPDRPHKLDKVSMTPKIPSKGAPKPNPWNSNPAGKAHNPGY